MAHDPYPDAPRPPRPPPHRAWRVVAAAVLSQLGEIVHNRIELPELALASPENVGPLVVTAALVAAWYWGPQRLSAGALLVWGGLRLVLGAVITVLPLAFLPFEPEQSAMHYLAHVIYGVAQVPLIVVAFREMRPAT